MKEEGWPIITDLDESPQEVVLVFKWGTIIIISKMKMENNMLQRKLWAFESRLAFAKFVQDNRPTAEALDCASGSM